MKPSTATQYAGINPRLFGVSPNVVAYLTLPATKHTSDDPTPRRGRRMNQSSKANLLNLQVLPIQPAFK